MNRDRYALCRTIVSSPSSFTTSARKAKMRGSAVFKKHDPKPETATARTSEEESLRPTLFNSVSSHVSAPVDQWSIKQQSAAARGGQAVFGDGAGGRIHLGNLVVVRLDEPQVVVRPGGQPLQAGAGGGHGEMADGTGCRDATDLAGAGLGEPQVAVRPCRDA